MYLNEQFSKNESKKEVKSNVSISLVTMNLNGQFSKNESKWKV